MGKAERKWSDVAEKNVSEALNKSIHSNINDDNHSEFDVTIAKTINNHLKKESVDFSRSVWSGANNYTTPGDIELLNECGEKMDSIELKFSKKTNEGTFKNVGSTWFTKEFGLTSYADFHKELGHEAASWAKVSEYCGVDVNKKPLYENELRAYKKKLSKSEWEDDSLKVFINSLASDSAGKYAKYVQEFFNNDVESLNIAIQRLLKSNISGSFNNLKFYYIIKNYEKKNQVVSVLDLSRISTQVSSVENSGKSIKILDSDGNVIIRFSVHWKNICQGGQTPCFNVFLGDQFKAAQL